MSERGWSAWRAPWHHSPELWAPRQMERALRHSCYRQELEVLITLLPEIADRSSRSICTKK